MIGTWWRAEGELIEEQREVLELDPDDSCLVTGPPGSGKTNLVVLRAKYLRALNRHNISLIVFTRSLRDFIAAGGEAYSVDGSIVTTERQWHIDLLNYQQVNIPEYSQLPFDQQQELIMGLVEQTIEEQELEDYFDTILVDEAQDYSARSMRIFQKMAKRMFIVADSKQSIHAGGTSLNQLAAKVQRTVKLKYNHRNGRRICAVADGILPAGKLEEYSQYDESERKSSVDVHRVANTQEMHDILYQRLQLQLKTYRREVVGVMCAQNDQVKDVLEYLAGTSLAGKVVKLGTGTRFGDAFPVAVGTIHSAKGLEFRAAHLLHADSIYAKGGKNLAYTAITRAKTALDVYHEEDMPRFLSQALAGVEPTPPPPTLKALLGGS